MTREVRHHLLIVISHVDSIAWLVADYLLSGLLYIPTGQLDAYYTSRWSATTQASAACILLPPLPSVPGAPSPPLSSSDMMLMSVQQDTGRWGTEYTWQSEGAGSMFGVRVLRNFGKLGNASGGEAGSEDAGTSKEALKRVDEEEAM